MDKSVINISQTRSERPFPIRSITRKKVCNMFPNFRRQMHEKKKKRIEIDQFCGEKYDNSYLIISLISKKALYI